MSDLAKLQQEPIFDGFADFFEEVHQTDPTLTRQSNTVDVSVAEAAIMLGVTERSVWRRLSKKKLVSISHAGKTYVRLQRPINDLRSDAIVTASVTSTDASLTVDVIEPIAETSHELIVRIEQLEKKLEGATYRNGYLEAENNGLRSLLNAKDSHIKLLTDSQHNRGWFKKFTSWLVGQSP